MGWNVLFDTISTLTLLFTVNLQSSLAFESRFGQPLHDDEILKDVRPCKKFVFTVSDIDEQLAMDKEGF